MNYKTKSLLLISFLIVAMVAVGILMNMSATGVTGAVVSKQVVCYHDNDCNDGIERTQDICRNKGTTNSICVNK